VDADDGDVGTDSSAPDILDGDEIENLENISDINDAESRLGVYSFMSLDNQHLLYAI
jgi:hypothetical protein